MLKKLKKLALKTLEKLEASTAEKTAAPAKIKAPKSTKKKDSTRIVQIPMNDVAKASLVIIGLFAAAFVFYEVRDIAFILFFSYLFAAALVPSVKKLQKYKIPKGVSVLIIYVVLITALSLMVGNLIPILSMELVDLAFHAQQLLSQFSDGSIELPRFLQTFQPAIQESFSNLSNTQITSSLQKNLLTAGGNLSSIAGNAVDLIISISNGLANAILVLVLTYFMTVDHESIERFIIALFPLKYQTYIENRSQRIKSKVGNWLKGQVLLMLAVGTLTYIGLVALGIKYAFTLALFAGFTELVPVVGPILAWVTTLPIAFNMGWSAVVAVSILYFIIQRLENNLLVPMIMKKATGLHPIVVITAMILGYKFQGVLGMIISIPLAGIVGMFLHDYLVKTHHIPEDTEG